MPLPAGSAKTAVGVQSRERRCDQFLARSQVIGPVEVVPSPAGMQARTRGLLEHQLPRSAPCQRAAPHVAAFFRRRAIRVEGEPGIELVAGHAPTALQHQLRRPERGLGQLGLRPPAAVEVAQPPAIPAWQPPVRRMCLADHEGKIAAVAECGPPLYHIEIVVTPVRQAGLQPVRYVFKVQHNGGCGALSRAPLARILPLNSARAVVVINLQRRLVITHSSPWHVLVGKFPRPGSPPLPQPWATSCLFGKAAHRLPPQ